MLAPLPVELYPIAISLLTVAPEASEMSPIKILLPPVVTLSQAEKPKATRLPVVFAPKAFRPIATL